jgi:hypothetical protein
MDPMSVTDFPWVFHGDSSVEMNNVGKWMLFYPVCQIDNKWKEMCDLYDNRKLIGISSMKCSTAYENSRSSNSDEKVIILYCNNSDDEKQIMEIGKILKQYIQDYKTSNTIYYKTDKQTKIGTYATGARKNYTYKLSVRD